MSRPRFRPPARGGERPDHALRQVESGGVEARRSVSLRVTLAALVALLAPLALPQSGLAKSPTCDSTWYPTPGTVAVNSTLNSKFNTYAASAGLGDWVGGDSTYSVVLPNGKTVWIYSDTFTGPVNPDGSIPWTNDFIHNSMLLDANGTMVTKRGGTASNPSALLSPSDPTHWYWADAAQVSTSDNTLQVIYMEMQPIDPNGTGPFNFEWVRNVLARYRLTDLHLLSTSTLPSTVANLEWSAWLYKSGGFTYIYGIEDTASNPDYVHVARVSGDDLRGTWKYYNGGTSGTESLNWSTGEANSARSGQDIGNNYSVSLIGGVYVLVTQDTSVPFGQDIVAYYSCSPRGPFTTKTFVYHVPEAGLFGTYHDSNIIFYNAHEHPQFRVGNTLTFSYDVNSADDPSNNVHNNVSIYRARFVNIPWTVPS
jgi:hypothetical protein